MKEIMAVIRMNMINKTKDALLAEGLPSLTCRKVLGRGKKKMDFSLIQQFISEEGGMQLPRVGEQISEGHRLIPKRMITIVLNDGEVKKAIDVIINVNSTGNPGDGKIFVLPVADTFRIRTGESGTGAV